MVMSKLDVHGVLIKLLSHTNESRGMRLIPEQSRCVRAGEIHELVTTDEQELKAGSRVNRVGFLGFAEISSAGVVDVGDRFLVEGRDIGAVVGFDDCHFPNHYNILIEVDTLLTAPDLDVQVGGQVEMRQNSDIRLP